MPEGDAVWLTARRLHGALAGRVLTETDFRVPRFATASLVGDTVTESIARGKHLLTRTSGGMTIHTHLKMDGRWQVGPPGRARRRGPWHEIRLVLSNAEYEAVGFRLPVVEILRTGDEARAVGHLGPDLLGSDWDDAEAVRRLSAQPDRTIGEALLDQRNLAGIGTIYRAETCFAVGVSPFARVRDVPNLAVLTETARRLLTEGIGDRPPRRWVYRRGGLPCRRCGTLIATGRLGSAPSDRLVNWCPTCQPHEGSAPVKTAP
jgi:endonuclease VIII